MIILAHYEQALLRSRNTEGQGIVTLIEDGTLLIHIKISLMRFVIGYVSAVILAILLGLMFGRIKWLWALLNPIVQLIRPVAPIAWAPFIVLWFGIGDIPAIV